MSLTTQGLRLLFIERTQANLQSGSLERTDADTCPKGRPACTRFPGCRGTCPRPRPALPAPANDTYTRRGRR